MSNLLMMSAEDTVLLIVDMQEKLLPAILGQDRILARCQFLLQAAEILHVPVLATEQYPKGLGTTVAPLSAHFSSVLATPVVEKVCFGCCGEPRFLTRLHQLGKRKVLIAGLETHVCVQQTAIGLLSEGYGVFLAADATGSRQEVDRHWALQRMAQAGITITTAESAVFEWTKQAGTSSFKAISTLVKQAGTAS